MTSLKLKPKLKALYNCAKDKLMHKYYPKLFLKTIAAKCKLPDAIEEWEAMSPLDLDIPIQQLQKENDFIDVSYSFPNYSLKRKNPEHRMMDPTHILTIMR